MKVTLEVAGQRGQDGVPMAGTAQGTGRERAGFVVGAGTRAQRRDGFHDLRLEQCPVKHSL